MGLVLLGVLPWMSEVSSPGLGITEPEPLRELGHMGMC